ncbi:MAG: PilZ domain-containing protein [Acidobacteriota bacterium]
MVNDRRQLKREPIFLDVLWEGSGGKHEARTSDISLGGCFVDTIGQVAVGETITLKLCLPTGEWIELQGEVRYELPRFGFGVSFLSLSVENQKKLFALIKTPNE